MTDPNSRIAELIVKHLRDELSGPEAQELQEWVEQSESNRLFFERFKDEEYLINGLKQYAAAKEASKEIRSKLDVLIAADNLVPVRRIGQHRFRNEKWVAAAVFFILTAGIFYFRSGRLSRTKLLPQNGLATLFTPPGKMDTVKLPDGTTVYLNASSTVRYASAFEGNMRSVELEGEAYFKIKENASRPFIVKTPHNGKIEVLGTSFNINTYNGITKTTLIDGRVKMLSSSDSAIVLSVPGQQSQDSLGHLSRREAVDPEKALAWKYNRFEFDDDLPSIMRELGAWYDLEVEYEAVIKGHFIIQLSRDLPVEKVLQELERFGPVHFKIEGKKIIVMN